MLSYKGLVRVQKGEWLPFRQHFPACDLATREEIKIPGIVVHFQTIQGQLYCSPEVYDKLKNTYKKQK